MHRFLVVLVACGLASGMAGCVAGDTDPATRVTADSAILNAHGRTVSGGPDYWWWEYATSASALGTAAAVEVCSESQGLERCGPNRASIDQKVSTDITGLTPGTTYYFRFCTLDVAPGSPTLCHRVLSFKTFRRDYVLDLSWGSLGDGEGQFRKIAGVATDSSNNVYVTDSEKSRVQKFNPSGSFLAKWGSFGGGDGQFRGPRGVATDGAGNVYVADSGNYRIEKFSSSGSFLAKWGSQGSGDGQFGTIGALAADSSGNVYVADSATQRIQKFDSSGHFLTKWGSQGSGDGQFSGPTGVAADASGNVYVADTGNQRIQKFDSSGRFLTKWGIEAAGLAGLGGVGNLATDASGAVYATKAAINGNTFPSDGISLVDKFSSSGSFLAGWVTKTFELNCGFGGCTPDASEYVAADRNGNAYIADVLNNQIKKFKPGQ